MRTIHRTIVSGLIFSKDGKLLMGQRIQKVAAYMQIAGIFLAVVQTSTH